MKAKFSKMVVIIISIFVLFAGKEVFALKDLCNQAKSDCIAFENSDRTLSAWESETTNVLCPIDHPHWYSFEKVTNGNVTVIRNFFNTSHGMQIDFSVTNWDFNDSTYHIRWSCTKEDDTANS